jgi:hypothetical protein
MNDTQRLHACVGHQKIQFGTLQSFGRRRIEQDEQRLRLPGGLGLPQQPGEAQTIDGRLVRHTRCAQCAPEFMYNARLEGQWDRGAHRIRVLQLLGKHRLVLGQRHRGGRHLIEQRGHFRRDAPQRGFVEPALCTQGLVQKNEPLACRQGLGDAGQRRAERPVAQRVEARHQQRPRQALRGALQGRLQFDGHRQGRDEHVQRRQVTCFDQVPMSLQQLIGKIVEECL